MAQPHKLALLGAALALLVTDPCQAGQTLTYAFSGTVFEAGWGVSFYSIAVGTPVTGSFSYDPDVIDADPHPQYGFYPHVATLSFTVGNVSNSGDAWIAIGDDVSSWPLVTGGRESATGLAEYNTPFGPISGDWLIVRNYQILPLGVVTLGLRGSPGYVGSSGNIWDSDQLPGPLPMALLAGGAMNIGRGGGGDFVNINITSVTPVPEPSTLAMAGLGALLGLGAWRRHRRAAA